MKLRGIDFGNVLGASGVQGFFGEGYLFHDVWKLLLLGQGPCFGGVTFVSKTATLFSWKGNMPLAPDHTPPNLFPTCVKVRFRRGLVLNAVGLSNPGLSALLNTSQWQKRTGPFFISIISIADTPRRRLEEFKILIDRVRSRKNEFLSPFGLQINLSCPNSGYSYELIEESIKFIEIATRLNVPLMPKYSIASAPIKAILELNDHPGCDSICVSNTLPFGWQGIDWKKIWGDSISPLESLGGGGLSGSTLRLLVCEWIRRLRNAGFTKPINGGGGILSVEDVKHYHDAGASSIFLGSIAILRPWRMRNVIKYANNLDWK